MMPTPLLRHRGLSALLSAAAAVLLVACAAPQATSSSTELPFEEAVAQADRKSVV